MQQQVQDLLNSKKVLYTLSIFILFIYFMPYFLYGQNVYMTTYDNLDSNIIWFKILAQSGKIFADSMDIIPNMMGGLPRLSYGSEFSLILWMYYFFPPFIASAVNTILVHSIAFASMLLLLSHYITEKDLRYRNLIIFSVSLLFALIPFWSNAGLSVAGQPLALYAFLNIRAHKENKWDWIILILLPFYSSFVLAFFFFLSTAGFLFIYDIFRTKKINYKFIFAIVLMIVIFLLVEYRLVYATFIDSGFISHRSEFQLTLGTFNHSFKQAHLIFLNGQDHNINLHFKYILPLILLALFTLIKKTSFGKIASMLILNTFILMFILGIWTELLTSLFSLPMLLGFSILLWIYTKEYKLFAFLFIIQIVISYFVGFYYYLGMGLVKEVFPLMEQFHFARFMMLQTLIWYILLALSLVILFKKLKFFIGLLLALIIFQVILAFQIRSFDNVHNETTSYKSYYATNLYKQIEEFIGGEKDTYRIVSLGIEPAVSLYAGFHTIDGYAANYPLSYKHEFRKIMKTYLNSLETHHGDAKTFDDWGSKCYIMTGTFSTKGYNKNIVLKNLNIDVNQLSSMGATYMFSAYKIEDSQSVNLTFLKRFDDNVTFWPIYLYKIK